MYFKTSHVKVYLLQHEKHCVHIEISKHLMLKFIVIQDNFLVYGKGRFQNISC